jgi:hypothetical protein
VVGEEGIGGSRRERGRQAGKRPDISINCTVDENALVDNDNADIIE